MPLQSDTHSLSKDPIAIAAAIDRIIKGVYLFTLQDDAGPAMTPGTALINFGREPHSLLWSLETHSSLFARLRRDVPVAVNMLTAEQGVLLRHCASSKGADRFAQGRWRHFEEGSPEAPWLLDAHAVLQCRIAEVWLHFGQAAVILAVESVLVAERSDGMCYSEGRTGRCTLE